MSEQYIGGQAFSKRDIERLIPKLCPVCREGLSAFVAQGFDAEGSFELREGCRQICNAHRPEEPHFTFGEWDELSSLQELRRFVKERYEDVRLECERSQGVLFAVSISKCSADCRKLHVQVAPIREPGEDTEDIAPTVAAHSTIQ
jgi:hypothetical protein